jgi:hypothetical protein
VAMLALPSNRCVYVMGALLLLILCEPFFERTTTGDSLLYLLVTAVLLSGTYAVSNRPVFRWAGAAIAAPTLVLKWAYVFSGNQTLGVLGLVGFVLFAAFAIAGLLAYALSVGDVTADHLSAAISVYLLTGLAFGVLFTLLEFARPGSLTHPPFRIVMRPLDWTDYLYFSFSNLTNLGLAENLPRTRVARTLTMLEAIAGVLYIAVMMARLVGIHIARHVSEDRRPGRTE